jgi:hypothetical protein
VTCIDRAQVEGTGIPEAVPVEGAVPEAEITTGAALSHPILQGKPNASHMCARIIYTHMIDKTRVIPLL